jgi:hypothetical protein
MFLNGNGLVEFGEKACGFWPELPCPCELRRQRNLPFRVRSANQTALNPKNKVEESGIFLLATERQFSHHVLPAFHHVLTIEKPRSTTCFFQNPPQKHQQKCRNHTVVNAGFFLKMKQSILRRNGLRK